MAASSSSPLSDEQLIENALQAQNKAHKEWEGEQSRMFGKMIGLMLNRPSINCSEDLRNGDVLIRLVEKLTGRSLNIAAAGERESRMQTLGRLNKLLEFLSADKVHVTVSAQNIYEGDLKLSLGLLWALIYHYQISNKKKILEWVNSLCSPLGFSVGNFTTAWNDGRALSVIVLALAQKLAVDTAAAGFAWGAELLAAANAERIGKALRVSEQLGIPPLLELSDVDVPRPDERIILTFVSYFYNSFIHGITIKVVPPPEPEPEPVVVVDDSELIALRAEVARLKDKLRAQKAEHKLLIGRVEEDLGDLKLCYDSLERKFVATLAELRQSEAKLDELNKKFALSKQGGGGGAGPPPMENVTMVRVGVAGNQRIWRANQEAMFTATSVFNATVRTRLHALGGHEIKYEAENFTLAFADAVSAVRFALALQSELAEKDWPPELSDVAEAAYVLDGDGNPLFCGLRAAVSMVTGDPYCERDPSTGRYVYSGPAFNALSSLAGLCQGGQILADKSTYTQIDKHMANIGSPDVKPLGEVSFTDLDGNLVVYQLLPSYLAARQFKPLASPEKLTAVMVGLETELTVLEKENIVLREALAKLHAQSQEGQSKVAGFSAWLKTKRGKTSPAGGKKSQLDAEIEQLLKGQQTLEQAVKLANANTEELEQSVVVLRRNLALAEKATQTLQQRYAELESVHAKCGEYRPPPRELLYPGCPRDNIVRAPRELVAFFELHPDLYISPDLNNHGNWLIGDGSYNLRQIHKGEVDPVDLLPSRDDREARRRTVSISQSKSKDRKARPMSLFFRRTQTINSTMPVPEPASPKAKPVDLPDAAAAKSKPTDLPDAAQPPPVSTTPPPPPEEQPKDVEPERRVSASKSSSGKRALKRKASKSMKRSPTAPENLNIDIE